MISKLLRKTLLLAGGACVVLVSSSTDATVVYDAYCKPANNPCSLPVPSTEACNSCTSGVLCGKPTNPPASNPCATSHKWVFNVAYGSCVDCPYQTCEEHYIACILEKTCIRVSYPNETFDCVFQGSVAYESRTACLYVQQPGEPDCETEENES